MGECLMPRRGGGGVRTGWAKPTTGETFAHDDFVGAKQVLILSYSTFDSDQVLYGFFEQDDPDSGYWNSTITYLDIYGDISGCGDDPGVCIDAATGVLYTSSAYFDTKSEYFYAAIY